MDPQFLEVDPNRGAGRFLIGENDPNLSNEEVVIDITAVVLREGRIMGKRTRGALAITAVTYGAGNVGNGVLAAAATADAGVEPGLYRATYIDADTFQVTGPGDYEQIGQQGAAFNGRVNFTHNVGATPNVAGDTLEWTVSYATANGQWGPVAPAAADGTQTAAGILYDRVGISTGVQKATMVCRHQVVNGNLLDFGALTAPQIATAEAQLAAQGIIVRY